MKGDFRFETLQGLIEVKRRVALGDFDSYGMCDALVQCLYDMGEGRLVRRAALATIRDLWQDWPHFTGLACYPVPNGIRDYGEAIHNRTCWSRGTTHGLYRRELLDWLIEELQK